MINLQLSIQAICKHRHFTVSVLEYWSRSDQHLQYCRVYLRAKNVECSGVISFKCNSECVALNYVSVTAITFALLDDMKLPMISEFERIEQAFITAIKQLSCMDLQHAFTKLLLFTFHLGCLSKVSFRFVMRTERGNVSSIWLKTV